MSYKISPSGIVLIPWRNRRPLCAACWLLLASLCLLGGDHPWCPCVGCSVSQVLCLQPCLLDALEGDVSR